MFFFHFTPKIPTPQKSRLHDSHLKLHRGIYTTLDRAHGSMRLGNPDKNDRSLRLEVSVYHPPHLGRIEVGMIGCAFSSTKGAVVKSACLFSISDMDHANIHFCGTPHKAGVSIGWSLLLLLLWMLKPLPLLWRCKHEDQLLISIIQGLISWELCIKSLELGQNGGFNYFLRDFSIKGLCACCVLVPIMKVVWNSLDLFLPSE